MISRIQLYAQVRAFLRTKYGDDPITYNLKDPNVTLLFQLFRNKGKNDPECAPGTDPLMVQLPDAFITQGRTYIHPEAIKLFNETMVTYIGDRVTDLVVERCALQERAKLKREMCYAREKFGLTEDILPYDVVKQRLYRYRKASASL